MGAQLVDDAPMSTDRRRAPRRTEPVEADVVEDIAEAIDDARQLREIGGLFLDGLARSRDELERGVQQRDLAILERVGHRLRGSSATFGALTLGDLAERLEDAAGAKHEQLALALAHGLLREIPHAERELRGHLLVMH